MNRIHKIAAHSVPTFIGLFVLMNCHQVTPSDSPVDNNPKVRTDGTVEPTTNSNTCDDGTCCGDKGTYYRYRETFSGDTVTLTGNSVKFNKPIPTGTDQEWMIYAETCTLTAGPVVGFIQKTLGRTDYETPIKCRIWGRLYTADKIIMPTNNGPLRYIAVDRIEAVK